MKTWTDVIDKSDWGEGPWTDEPDKVQWIDESTDLDCLIVRGPQGSLCGYVGLPPGHPLHGADYEKAGDVEVHGGLTFADRCMEDMPEGEGVCHVPEPGRPADVWWLGFDCGHFMDISPGFDARMREAFPPGHPLAYATLLGGPLAHAFDGTYKPIGYVREEVTHLAAQLADPRPERKGMN